MIRVKFCLLVVFAVTAIVSLPAQALEQIVRPYQSIRSGGMGGVRMTTGLYDENFFSNPARVTANPKFRWTLFDMMAELNSNSFSTAGNLTGGGSAIQKLGETAGKNNHLRLQTTFPLSFYIPTGAEGKWAFAFGLITSTQFDIDMRNSFQLAPQGIVDVGPAFTIGRKLLPNDALSVGATTHVIYRAATTSVMTLADYLHNPAIGLSDIGQDGAMIDFDIGGTYVLPIQFLDFDFTAGAAINNILGGNYSNLPVTTLKSGVRPLPQPRTLGFGASAHRSALGPFNNAVFALEFTDIGNNPNGSLFRTFHLGGEAHYGVLAPRLGINQGYLAAGLGLDLRFFALDLATYAEEMSLNPGGNGDRRYAIRLAFQI